MRLKVKLLFMIAVGLLFFAGPMVGSAFAGPGAVVDVSLPTASSGSNCSTAFGGEPYLQVDGTAPNGEDAYDVIYRFNVAPGSTGPCTASLDSLGFRLTNAGEPAGASFHFGTYASGNSTWSQSTFSLSTSNSFTADGLTFSVSGLSGPSTYNYLSAFRFTSCTGCSPSPSPTVIFQDAYSGDFLSGTVGIAVSVDLDRFAGAH